MLAYSSKILWRIFEALIDRNQVLEKYNVAISITTSTDRMCLSFEMGFIRNGWHDRRGQDRFGLMRLGWAGNAICGCRS